MFFIPKQNMFTHFLALHSETGLKKMTINKEGKSRKKQMINVPTGET